MNLDAISNRFPIDEACKRVVTSEEECPWLVLGYSSSASQVFTLEVSKCGTKWNEVLAVLCPDKIQYVYLKLDAGIVDPTIPLKNRYLLILITWLGERVGNNILTECEHHSDKIREVIPKIDCEMICKTVRDILTHVENLQHTESFARYKSLRECKIKPIVDQSSAQFTFFILGDMCIGKTSIIHRLVRHEFQFCYGSTIVCNLSMLSKQYNGIPFNFVIWDTGGGKMGFSHTTEFLRNWQAIVLVYSIVNKITLDVCRTRFNPEKLKQCARSNVAMMLLGNKSDLNKDRAVTYQEGEEFAQEFGIPLFFEVSAKTGENIEEAFGAFIQLIAINSQRKGDVIELGLPNDRATSNCCDIGTQCY